MLWGAALWCLAGGLALGWPGPAGAQVRAAAAPPPQAVVTLRPTEATLPGGGRRAVAAGQALTFLRADAAGLWAAALGPGGTPSPATLQAQAQAPGREPVFQVSCPALAAAPWVNATALALADGPVPAPGHPVQLLVAWWGRLPAADAVALPGLAAWQAARLARLAVARVPGPVRERLLAGRLVEGDDMWRATLAWGQPQRRFMVNHLQDEEHFVYIWPGWRPVYLSFKSGGLVRVPPLVPSVNQSK